MNNVNMEAMRNDFLKVMDTAGIEGSFSIVTPFSGSTFTNISLGFAKWLVKWDKKMYA